MGDNLSTGASAILATTNGGATWKAQNPGTTVYPLSAVAFANARDGWVVGNNGTILATTNGGATWKAQQSDTIEALYAVTFANASHGWAVGAGGTILAYTSGVLVTPHLTLKLSGLKSGALKLGKRLTAKGKVTPASLAGSKVTLTVQRKQGGKWRKVKSTTRTIRASGAYSGKYKPTKKGSYRIRATMAKTGTNTAATTKWRTFKVR